MLTPAVSVGESPYVNLQRYEYPEFGTTWVEQVHKGPYSHGKMKIHNNLNADDGSILQGELLLVLRLMMAQLRRARFIDHMVAPVSPSAPLPFQDQARSPNLISRR